MTVKEYFLQAQGLERKLNSDIEELIWTRRTADRISAVAAPGDRVSTSGSGEAPFVHSVERILSLEQTISQEVESLICLREQMREVIAAVPSVDEQMVLRYRHIHNLTWRSIGALLGMDERSVRRRYGSALRHVELPANPVCI